ncbi:nucleoid-associated protein YgaU [Sagittula marina]|uniref:Nucleoid-associated protein YgaU n=1 Tax=Sagittula marina TaxID=943940 RepID=A0A7W6DRP1_9RHOB|nr:LysM peptidoglycan-binding domain-containing protein [Sagittula marina]MBB3983924.1 nucleoid-associated protein YgaU [Sagittula marina]
MIRAILLTVGFAACTFALLWTVGDLTDSEPPTDQVSRATPDVMGLQPAKTPTAEASYTEQAAPSDVRPMAQPDLRQPLPVQNATQVSVAPQVDNVIEAMGYGILEELKKPSSRTLARVQPQEVAVVGPVNSVDPISAARSYTVKPGDSLPGIAFRFYGTTVAYLQILDANQDVVRDPAALRSGMVLTIPD